MEKDGQILVGEMVESLMVSATRKYELIIPNFILNQDPT
jgi:hypothetical protein